MQAVDGVDIVTPCGTHYELIKKCLEFTNVLVEKPIVTNPDLAFDLKQCAEKLGRILMVGHVYRFHPVVQELKKQISKIGKSPKQTTGVKTNLRETGFERF